MTLDRDCELQGNTDTSFLKVLALCIMLVDHIGASIFTGIPELRYIGRIAFPLYAWCLVVGSVKTRNAPRYIGRLLLLAVVSQPIYMVALNHDWQTLNILFTLSLALMGIYGVRQKRFGSQFWAPVLCLLVSCFVKVDYGWKGILFIYVLYGCRKSRSALAMGILAYALFWGGSNTAITQLFGVALPWVGYAPLNNVLSCFLRTQTLVWLAIPLIVLPTQVRLTLPKWLGYALYPMHLILLILLRLAFGTPLAYMLGHLAL